MDTRDSALLANLFSFAVGLAFWAFVIGALILLTNTPSDWAQGLRDWIDAKA